MDPLNNPFSPGAGNPPPELAGRREILSQAQLLLARILKGRHEPGIMLVGLRGVGKTVLLNRINDVALSTGYGVAFIEATEGRTLPELLIPALRRELFKLDTGARLSDKVKRGLRVLRSFIGAVKLDVEGVGVSLDVDPERGIADSGDLETDLADLFVAVAEAAQDRSTGIAVIVDELQYIREPEMSALIMAMHRISQRQLPIAFIGAGLPQLVGLAGKAKSYAERLFRYVEVGALADADARSALQEPALKQKVKFTNEALGELVRVTGGYPYFLQEWGYNVWNIATASPIGASTIKTATQLTIQKLDHSFFRVRFDRLTPKEKEYLRALADLGAGSHRSGDIAARLGKRSQSIGMVRDGLVRKGMIFSPSHGITAFTVPLFDEFMRRTMPDWKATTKKTKAPKR